MKRRVTAAAIAALCLCSATTSLFAGATTYDACDVNHDGSVNMTDVITINRFLLGADYYPNYNQLDANRSHTVDAADATCVMSKITQTPYSACYIRQYANAYMEVVNMPAVSNTITLDNTTNATNVRTYKRYSYDDDCYLSPYTLTTSSLTLNSPQSRDILNGDDNRNVAHGYENTGIVYLENIGTGFIIGDHEIATAAHCVFNSNGIRKNIEILTYDRTGQPDGGELHVSEIHLPQDYSVIKECTPDDFALIIVEEDLSDRIHFSIGNSYNMTNSEVGTIPLHVTGIPDKKPNGEPDEENDMLYTHFGSIYGNDNRSLLHYTVDTTGGQSGSPVYTITRERYNSTDYYTYTALAIHTAGPDGAGYNYGTLMTKYQLNFYRNNPYVN
ncbi:MAG: trypsin-like peptidase domain-containing protein [Oscillospiraceae bacterium]|nr:trypsin-like peptidase domain-containing protein [Oscillospiraceae bacterium]MBR4101549.1 trypsin-like peptidase domain-containing protein [Oscillospiraceae bacterium]